MDIAGQANGIRDWCPPKIMAKVKLVGKSWRIVANISARFNFAVLVRVGGETAGLHICCPKKVKNCFLVNSLNY